MAVAPDTCQARLVQTAQSPVLEAIRRAIATGHDGGPTCRVRLGLRLHLGLMAGHLEHVLSVAERYKPPIGKSMT